jgi:hypothetical protein
MITNPGALRKTRLARIGWRAVMSKGIEVVIPEFDALNPVTIKP